jgi:hypothetical protein
LGQCRNAGQADKKQKRHNETAQFHFGPHFRQRYAFPIAPKEDALIASAKFVSEYAMLAAERTYGDAACPEADISGEQKSNPPLWRQQCRKTRKRAQWHPVRKSGILMLY